MKTDTRLLSQIFNLQSINLQSFDFLERPPFPVRAGELQFVPVFVDMLTAQYRTDFRQFYFPDSRQVIHDLLLLISQLLLVRQYLPFTSAAYAEMLALRGAPYSTRLHQPQHAGLHERVFLLRHLQVHYIARHAVRHKANDSVNPHNCLSFCSHTRDLHVLINR